MIIVGATNVDEIVDTLVLCNDEGSKIFNTVIPNPSTKKVRRSFNSNLHPRRDVLTVVYFILWSLSHATPRHPKLGKTLIWSRRFFGIYTRTSDADIHGALIPDVYGIIFVNRYTVRCMVYVQYTVHYMMKRDT